MALEHEALTERIRYIVVDLKAIKNVDDIHFAVVRSQLKAVGRQHGLLPNFAKTTPEPKRVIAS